MTIQWETPPERGGTAGRGKSQRFVAQLKERPGEWAIYPHPVAYPTQAGAHLRKFGCETAVRTGNDGVVRLYVRWPA